MRVKGLVLALCAWSAAIVHLQIAIAQAEPVRSATPQTSTPAAERRFEDRDGAFTAQIHAVTAAEAERFLQEWHSTPTEHGPRLEIAETARRGDTMNVLIFYVGCAADAPVGGDCPARADLRILAPDGSVYGEYRDLPLAEGVPTAPQLVQLSPLGLGIVFEPEDAPGRYRIQADIRDPQRDLSLALETTVELVLDPPQE
jgi:hypothetical protein